MTADDPKNIDLRGFAAIINSRLAVEAQIAKAMGFGWLCGGVAIASILTGLGVGAAFYGYAFMISVEPAGDQVAKALVEALQRSEIKTTVSGTMSLSPDSQLKLANGQTVKLEEGTIVKLDPNSSVHVVGDIKMPQPSKYQLQADTTTGGDDLPFTNYMVFKTVKLGAGVVETGWLYELSDTTRPRLQNCYYRQAFDEGLAGKITIALNGAPQPLSPLVKLPFKFEEALADCIWFSGY
jgi:hypothetical protein